MEKKKTTMEDLLLSLFISMADLFSMCKSFLMIPTRQKVKKNKLLSTNHFFLIDHHQHSMLPNTLLTGQKCFTCSSNLSTYRVCGK